MQLACILWVQPRNTRDDGWGKSHKSSQTHDSLSLHDLLSTGCHLFGVSFRVNLESNLCTSLSTYNTTENDCIVSYPQNATQFHSVFGILTETHRLLSTSKGRSVIIQRKQLPRSTENSSVRMCYCSCSI
jgi:hypothetical protein